MFQTTPSHQLSNAVLYHPWWNKPSEPWTRIKTSLPCFYDVVCHSNEKGKQSTIFQVLISTKNTFKVVFSIYFRFTEQNCQQIPLIFTICEACLGVINHYSIRMARCGNTSNIETQFCSHFAWLLYSHVWRHPVEIKIHEKYSSWSQMKTS